MRVLLEKLVQLLLQHSMVVGGKDADTGHLVSPPVAGSNSNVAACGRDYQQHKSTERG